MNKTQQKYHLQRSIMNKTQQKYPLRRNIMNKHNKNITHKEIL